MCRGEASSEVPRLGEGLRKHGKNARRRTAMVNVAIALSNYFLRHGIRSSMLVPPPWYKGIEEEAEVYEEI